MFWYKKKKKAFYLKPPRYLESLPGSEEMVESINRLIYWQRHLTSEKGSHWMLDKNPETLTEEDRKFLCLEEEPK